MAEDHVHESEGEFRIMALDGGICGLFSAALLAFLLTGWFRGVLRTSARHAALTAEVDLTEARAVGTSGGITC